MFPVTFKKKAEPYPSLCCKYISITSCLMNTEELILCHLELMHMLYNWKHILKLMYMSHLENKTSKTSEPVFSEQTNFQFYVLYKFYTQYVHINTQTHT